MNVDSAIDAYAMTEILTTVFKKWQIDCSIPCLPRKTFSMSCGIQLLWSTGLNSALSHYCRSKKDLSIQMAVPLVHVLLYSLWRPLVNYSVPLSRLPTIKIMRCNSNVLPLKTKYYRVKLWQRPAIWIRRSERNLRKAFFGLAQTHITWTAVQESIDFKMDFTSFQLNFHRGTSVVKCASQNYAVFLVWNLRFMQIRLSLQSYPGIFGAVLE